MMFDTDTYLVVLCLSRAVCVGRWTKVSGYLMERVVITCQTSLLSDLKDFFNKMFETAMLVV